MRTSGYTRAAFALTAVKCAHLLVMIEDGASSLVDLLVPRHLRPRPDAIEQTMRASMAVAVGTAQAAC